MTQTDVFKNFIDPIVDSMINNVFSRKCAELTDDEFIQLGIRRVLGDDKSGRAFLQRIKMEKISDIELSHFFKSLKSTRRVNHLKKVFNLLTTGANKKLMESDRLKEYRELDKFEIFAADGSYVEWACHDEKFLLSKTLNIDSDNRVATHVSSKRSTQNYYAFNFRTKVAHHLAVAQIGDAKKKEHDIHALKRLTKNELRLNTPTGKKVLFVYDRASIDYFQWYKWKNNDGIYFLSREKSNSALKVVGQPAFDKNDPVNFGVISNESVGTGNGEAFRRVVYKCPDTGQTFSFVTTLPDKIRPGVIVMLYKLRWEIEKLFDTFKNKLEEKKAWASTENAKCMQSIFICLTYNLTLLIDKRIEEKEGVKYTYDKKRKEKALHKKQKQIAENGLRFTTTWQISAKSSQITIKLFRWLRTYTSDPASWLDAIAQLKVLYGEF